MEALEAELDALVHHCAHSGFSRRQLDTIYSPLWRAHNNKSLGSLAKTLLTLALAFFALYSALHLNLLEKPAYSLAKIAIIKILPFWDWSYLFYESCLINNPFYGDYVLTEEDCLPCETIHTIDIVENITYDGLQENFLSRDVPVIVSDAMDNWTSSDTYFGIENITELYLSDLNLINTLPCTMSTNIRYGSSDLYKFLRIIQNPNFGKWFVHWQNCDIVAVKALRMFYLKPYFLSNSIAPAHFNWILMSSEYTSNVYKKLKLDSGLIMMAQLRGQTGFKLSPITPCNESCTVLKGNIFQGEILVFTNFLWNFEYRMNSKTQNIAILMETTWGDGLS